jgi:hypothetical protein
MSGSLTNIFRSTDETRKEEEEQGRGRRMKYETKSK